MTLNKTSAFQLRLFESSTLPPPLRQHEEEAEAEEKALLFSLRFNTEK